MPTTATAWGVAWGLSCPMMHRSPNGRSPDTPNAPGRTRPGCGAVRVRRRGPHWQLRPGNGRAGTIAYTQTYIQDTCRGTKGIRTCTGERGKGEGLASGLSTTAARRHAPPTPPPPAPYPPPPPNPSKNTCRRGSAPSPLSQRGVVLPRRGGRRGREGRRRGTSEGGRERTPPQRRTAGGASGSKSL